MTSCTCNKAELRASVGLAPMQDVTDLAFMRTLHRLGSLPDFFITPYFRSTPTTCAMGEENLRCILENETGVPIHAQLAGSEPGALSRDAERLLARPIAGINLNAGCPSPLVNRHHAGAGLLRDLPRLTDCLNALRRIVPAGQFSVKCRLGWDSPEEFPRLLELLTEAHPDGVMVHARTRRQLYGGVPHIASLALAARTLPCPVLGNGDITSPQQAADVLRITPAGILIGRGAVRNPFIFRMLRGGPAPSRAERAAYFTILAEEIGRTLHTKRTPAGHCNRLKKYLAFCYPDFSPEQEYTLRRATELGPMLRILTAL